MAINCDDITLNYILYLNDIFEIEFDINDGHTSYEG